MTGPVSGARTIERALGVLDAFTRGEPHWRTTRLAEHCGLPVPTTHRILRVLERYGYLSREPSRGAYALGPAAAALARGVEPPLAMLHEAALPTLRSLAEQTGASVSASAVADSRDHRLELAAPFAARAPGKAALPLHAGAASKALLAQLSAEDLESVLSGRLESLAPETIISPPALRRQVNAIRRRRWAFSRQEVEAGRWALAVPVRGPAGEPYALAASAPLEELAPDCARQRIMALTLAARALSERLATTVTPRRRGSHAHRRPHPAPANGEARSRPRRREERRRWQTA